MNSNKGALFIISAPSGAGKSSLINAYLQSTKKTSSVVSVSHTTRAPRPGESNNIHYHFVDEATFLQMMKQDDFVEHAKVYDHYYGTSKKAIESHLNSGVNVFLDIDWQGAKQVKEKMPNAVSIFILPPSIDALEQRLVARGQDSEETIQKRMKIAKDEISHYTEYDYLIINDSFEHALLELQSIVLSESLKTERYQFSSDLYN